MWETTLDGRQLTFRLSGINNQNFLMSDEQTGSWWQQVTGEAIHGPLKGRRLTLVLQDELPFAIWKREHPHGRVLRPDPEAAIHYEPADWERRIGELPVVTPGRADDPWSPRTLVVGMQIDGIAKAYELAAIQRERLLIDQIGSVPVMLLTDSTGRSVRVFDRTVGGRTLEFFRSAAGNDRLMEASTGSEWDFSGMAVSGPLIGQRLRRIPALTEYWFDWKTYHPATLRQPPGR